MSRWELIGVRASRPYALTWRCHSESAEPRGWRRGRERWSAMRNPPSSSSLSAASRESRGGFLRLALLAQDRLFAALCPSRHPAAPEATPSLDDSAKVTHSVPAIRVFLTGYTTSYMSGERASRLLPSGVPARRFLSPPARPTSSHHSESRDLRFDAFNRFSARRNLISGAPSATCRSIPLTAHPRHRPDTPGSAHASLRTVRRSPRPCLRQRGSR